jgi:hypothetical protein
MMSILSLKVSFLFYFSFLFFSSFDLLRFPSIRGSLCSFNGIMVKQKDLSSILWEEILNAIQSHNISPRPASAIIIPYAQPEVIRIFSTFINIPLISLSLHIRRRWIQLLFLFLLKYPSRNCKTWYLLQLEALEKYAFINLFPPPSVSYFLVIWFFLAIMS